jgi:hypothetical protein
MSQTRTNYPAGPAYLTAGGLTMEFAEGWKSQSEIKTAPINTNLHGQVGASRMHVETKITGKVIATTGNLASLLAYLLPYTCDMIGQLIFPSTDAPAVIQTRDGKSITYPASAVTKMPEINFAANVDIFGETEITCLSAFEADPTAAANVALVQSSAFTAPSTNPLLRLRNPYTVAWGSSSPFSAIETAKGGVKFTPTVKLTPVETDLWGVINYRIDGVDSTAKFTPLNLDSGDFFNLVQLYSANAGIGKILNNDGLPLTVTSSIVGGLNLTMPCAVPTQGPLGFDNKSRIGEVTLIGERLSTSGVLGNNFTLAVRTS